MSDDPPHTAPSGRADRAIEQVVLAACRWYRWVLIGFALAVALSIWAATGLRVDTDSSRMIDTSLPFQQREAALNAAFPLLDDTIAVVVRAPHTDAADAALAALAASLADQPSVADVFAPAIDP